MAQVKIYGLRKHLTKNRTLISKAIHESVMAAFGLPENKRFHRFIMLEEEDFLFPDDRNEKYTIIELSIFEGRSKGSKKELIKLMFGKLHSYAGIDTQNVEITIFETPMANWGIRGMPGDELVLNYKVTV